MSSFGVGEGYRGCGWLAMGALLLALATGCSPDKPVAPVTPPKPKADPIVAPPTDPVIPTPGSPEVKPPVEAPEIKPAPEVPEVKPPVPAPEVPPAVPAPEAAPAPAGETKKFVNSKEGRMGTLLERYVDFSFEYPASWKVVPTEQEGPNFVKVERAIVGDTPDDAFTVENFAVGNFALEAPPALALEFLPLLAEQLDAQFAKGFPNYKKLSAAATTVAGIKGYETRFTAMVPGTPKGDITFWGRCVLLPDPAGNGKGITLIFLATSLSPAVKSAEDLGVKGELPVILKSLKLGKPAEKTPPPAIEP